MSRVQYAVSEKLAAECEGRPGWDEQPTLYRVHVKAGNPALVVVPIPRFMWNAARPPEVLDLVAELMESGRFTMVPLGGEDKWGDLRGMAVLTEAWSVDTLAKGAEHRRAQVYAGDHKLYLHPDRIEIRQMTAVDVEQITYACTLYRGEAKAERLIAYPDGRGEGFGRRIESHLGGPGKVEPTGAVTEALDRMVYQLTGVAPRKRASSYIGGDPKWS